MIDNPFPGPRAYRRATDRSRFFGREALSHKVEHMVLGHRAVTLYGPSAAGKTSLMLISVLPKLVESDDIRVIAVNGWPESRSPVEWLASTMRTALQHGEPPSGVAASDAVLLCAKRAARSSPRLMLVYLDQIEQVLYTNREARAADELFDCLHQLAELPLRAVRIVLSLREDYIGRLRDRLQDRRRLLDHMVRVGPLTVGELTDGACRAAALGVPPISWSAERIGPMMRQVRAPGQPDADEAEAQLAYGQIVCRALFQSESMNGPAEETGAEAESILRSYLDERLVELGALHEPAQRLLEDHLITADGSRTLRAEHELVRLIKSPEPSTVIYALEKAAIVQAREHDGARYLEIGHDWLARRVRELRDERAREPAQAPENTSPGLRPEEIKAPGPSAPERGPEAQDARDLAIIELRGQRRMLVAVLVTLTLVVMICCALSVWAWQNRAARAAADERGSCP